MFVIYKDAEQLTVDRGPKTGHTYTQGALYFIRLGLGVFWECSSDLAEAKRFTRRADASKVLRESGKARQGWRVIPA